jgi:IS30 family transposase
MKKPKKSSREGCPDLLLQDRQEIFRLRNHGKSIQKISELVKCSKSTVHGTLNHESLKKGHAKLPWYEKGKLVHDAIKGNRGRKRIRYATLKSQEILDYVVKCLKDKLSPKNISDKIKLDHPDLKISHESIYQYIYNSDPSLLQYLTRKGKTRRNKEYKGNHPRVVNKENVLKKSVHDRCAEGNNRESIGHSESDFIVSCRGGKSVLLVEADRSCRQVHLRLLPNREAETTRAVMFEICTLKKAAGGIKTLTVDNDTAHNNLHYLEPVFKDSDLKILFCDPYKAWQRGTIEAINGILRRWFPKGTNFDLISNEQVQYVENWFNNRPMKVLNGITPNMAYEQGLEKMKKAA